MSIFRKIFNRNSKKELDSTEIQKLDISNIANGRNVHEKLISKLYLRSIEDPNLYKNVQLTSFNNIECKDIIVGETRLRLYNHCPLDRFPYNWKLEYHELDQQALFPEYVEGNLAEITYSFDVRSEYSVFLKSFFNHKEEDYLSELL